MAPNAHTWGTYLELQLLDLEAKNIFNITRFSQIISSNGENNFALLRVLAASYSHQHLVSLNF